MPKDKIKLSDANTGKMLTIQTATESLEKDVTLIVPSKDSVLVSKEDMEKHIDDVSNEISNIRKPMILSPVQNEQDFDGNITLTDYNPSPLYTGLHTNTIIQVARDIDFTDLVVNEELSNVNMYIPSFTESEAKYYVRAMYKSDLIVSKWSDVVEFTTINANISRPVVTISGVNVNSVDDGALISINDFTSISSGEVHVSTTWKVVHPVTGVTVWESVNDEVNLTKINIVRGNLAPNTSYLIKVNLNGNINGVSPTGYLGIKTISEFVYVGDDNNQYAISTYNGTDYFGEVGIDQLDGTYNYRGPYTVGRPNKDYSKDEQVLYNGVLYRSLKDHVNITPGTDGTTWEVDTRDNLPTGKWVLDQVGIGYGLTDRNVDGRSSGSISLGNLKNNDQGWLKYVREGKLIYVAKKPYVDTIAWTDIAKREAESGKRTIRIGKHLYYVRLMKQDEFNNCMVNVTNGMLDNLSSVDISTTEKCWLIDSSVGTFRSRTNGSTGIENFDCKSRTGSYRPVLEYIPEGQEPYNNIKLGLPLATAENFQYDFYTDTGYFGHVPSTSLIGGDSLATTVGLTAGTAQNDTTGYFKFYWHGILLYVCKQSIRHTVSWDQMNAVNVIYGKDMGGTGLKTVTVGSNTYAVQLLLGSGKSPEDTVTYWSDFGTQTEAVFNRNVKAELGRGSQWNDLIYRVNTHVPTNRWVDQIDDANYRNLTGGVQIGTNWANYTNAEMSIYYAQGGNGTASWCQKISQYSNNTYRTNRGHYRLSDLDASTSSSAYADSGARLVLRVL